MKRFLVIATVLVGLGYLSCDHNEYALKIAPRGQAVERQLTVFRDGKGNFPQAELERIGKVYGKAAQEKPEKDITKYTFDGHSSGKMPDDVGGAGTYTCFETAMGSAGIYMERFRGTDDLAGQLEIRMQAADKIADLLLGWLKSEFGKHEEFPKIKRFMDTDFRQDIKNLSLYFRSLADVMLTDGGPGEGGPEVGPKGEAIARIAQYFLERGYIRTTDIPTAARLMARPDPKRTEAALGRLLRNALSAKAGVKDVRIADRLAALLADSEALDRSVSAYLSTTSDYKKLLADWKSRKAKQRAPGGSAGKDENAAEGEPGSLDVLKVQMDLWVGRSLGPSDDNLTVLFSPEGQVVKTNGHFDKATGEITWQHLMEKRGESRTLPLMCFAVTAQPAEEFQKQHFGKVVLQGQNLVNYCLWRKGLGDNKATEWDAFLESLRPDRQSFLRLDKFRFSDEPTTQPAGGAFAEPRSDAASAVEMILNALKGSPTTRPAQ